MGNSNSIIMVPDRSVMINIIDRIVELEGKIKRGEQLTRVQEKEKKELQKVANVMKKIQKKSVNRVGNLTTNDSTESEA